MDASKHTPGIEEQGSARSQPCADAQTRSHEAQPSAAFTPGPWHVGGEEGRVIRADARVVATAGNMACNTAYKESERRPFVRQAQSDARLIAAAPELLASLDPQGLEFAADCLERLERAPRIVERLRAMAATQRAALSKATGEQP